MGTRATQATGGSRDAVALFYTHRFRQSCSVIAVGGGTQVAASTAEGGVFVRTDAKDLVGAFVSGKEHHRYRFAFRVVTGAGVAHRVVVRAARKPGDTTVRLRDLGHLRSFTRASVTITDLTAHGPARSYAIAC